MPLRIAIAEDNSFALKSILEKLSAFPEVLVKIKAPNGRDLLQQLEADALVELVLMDIQMPEMDGIEATAWVRHRYPQIKVIMLTTFDDDEKIFEAIMAGANGYLLKEESAELIVQALHMAVEGGAAMSPGIALKALNLIRNPLHGGAGKLQDFGLTKREMELLEQLKNGRTYEQIAENLIISIGTVRKHIENVYRKLQVNNKMDAIQKASQNRLL
ncbi:response regulator transcription factor [Cytophagales bacterium LB-30]|uniref:Response regulator transcription factor n=1 Tax=Shiella aurantiaca TaxID=3058365 RepID=A0ABT8F7M1_9BACT|nr:response regulator transcription factor [Shiella aurantiaca]MDN4166482.1 response regulator transcription factor [Shiella aurantiaca]